MTVLYILAFITSLLGLLMWFLFKGNRARSLMMSKIFLGGFFIYLVALTFAPGDLASKLFILFRDFLVISLVALLFDRVQKNKILLVAFAILIGMLFGGVYLRILKDSFPVNLLPSSEIISDDREFLYLPANGSHSEAILSFLEEQGGSMTQPFKEAAINDAGLSAFYAIDFPEDLPLDNRALYKELRKRLPPGDYLEVNEICTIPQVSSVKPKMKGNSITNDPLVREQWWLEHLDAHSFYKLLESHPQTSKRPRVAILDTGVDANHEDIDSYLSINRNYDKDAHGHGTLCAGIVAATTNNGKGVASMTLVDHTNLISGISVMNRYGRGNQIAIIDGILKAVNEGVDVISLSLGGRKTEKAQSVYKKAFEYCKRNNVIVVASAGNSGEDARDYAPAGIDGVICVGAMDQNGLPASFSNTVDKVDMGIYAPGVGIMTTRTGSAYGAHSGTSFSGPMVAALVATMRSYRPDINAEEVYRIMNETGDEVQGVVAKQINPVKALETLLHQNSLSSD